VEEPVIIITVGTEETVMLAESNIVQTYWHW